MVICTGEGWNGDHCCYVEGEPCEYLVENQVGRRYACALMIKYGTWAVMTASPEYHPIGKYWESRSLPFNICQVFPPVMCCGYQENLNLGTDGPAFRHWIEAVEAGF